MSMASVMAALAMAFEMSASLVQVCNDESLVLQAVNNKAAADTATKESVFDSTDEVNDVVIFKPNGISECALMK